MGSAIRSMTDSGTGVGPGVNNRFFNLILCWGRKKYHFLNLDARNAHFYGSHKKKAPKNSGLLTLSTRLISNCFFFLSPALLHTAFDNFHQIVFSLA